MDRSIGAYIDEKTGHEMQTLASGNLVDVDAELARLGVKHDAADMDSPERWALRQHYASVGYAKDDDAHRAAIKGHLERHRKTQEVRKAEAARLASEADVVAGRKSMADHVREHVAPRA